MMINSASTAPKFEKKLAQFNEFFSIEQHFSININVLDEAITLDFDTFIQRMPMPFKMASDVVNIEQSALRSIKGLGNHAEQLVEFLNHQSRKIDLLVGYILSQQDEAQHRYQGIKFGGGGVIFVAKKPFVLAQMLEMKIFMSHENVAIYCYGEVIAIDQNSDDGLYYHKVVFHFVQEEDREILVRASLHEQSKQLQLLAKKRNQQS